MPRVFFAVTAVLFLILPGFSGASELHSSETSCLRSSDGDLRVVQVVYDNPSNPLPCTVLYTKNGHTKNSGSAKNTRGHCERIERDIVRNLVKAGFSCEHEFTGALNPRRDDIVMDLFALPISSQPNTIEKNAVDPQHDQLLNDVTSTTSSEIETSAGNAELIEDELDLRLAQLEQKLEALLREEFSTIAAHYLELDSQQTLALSIDLSIDLLPHSDSNYTTAITIDNNRTDSQPINTLPKATEPSAEPAANQPSTEPSTSETFALLSDGLASEEDAHRFAADFHRIYPRVESRVVSIRPGDNAAGDIQWHLSLGTGSEAAQLQAGLQQLQADHGQQFSVRSIDPSGSSSMQAVSNDWMRYLVAACFAEGKTNSKSLQSCSGYQLGLDNLVGCLGGGVCTIDTRIDEKAAELVDFLEVLGGQDPAGTARRLLMDKVNNCGAEGANDSDAFTRCAARALMTDSQRQMLDCYEQSGNHVDLLRCSNNSEIADTLALYERCSGDTASAAECLLEQVDNQYLSSATACLKMESQSAIVSCALRENLATDEIKVLDCLQQPAGNTDRAACLADSYLDDEQRQLLACANDSQDASAFGLCAASASGTLSSEEIQLAECIASGRSNGNALLDCAGGRFAAAELDRCAERGETGSDCLLEEIVVGAVARGAIDNLLGDQLAASEIAAIRESMFANQGGDIPAILASATLTKVFSSTVEATREVTKKAVSKTTSTSKKLWNKLRRSTD